MTPMDRILKELDAQRRTWASFYSYLGATKQDAGNWKTNGFPSKFYTQSDDFFNKPRGWTELGDPDGQNAAPRLLERQAAVLMRQLSDDQLRATVDYMEWQLSPKKLDHPKATGTAGHAR